MHKTRREFMSGAGALGLSLTLPIGISLANPSSVHAADWKPTKTVTLIVPTPVAGPTDFMGRLLAEHLKVVWGQPVIIDNKGGAGGTIGAAQFVRHEPDGYTLFVGNPGANAVAYSVYRELPYKPEQFTPVCGLGKVAGLVSVHPSVPVNTLRELVAYIKANPGKLHYASAGTGQSTHLAAAWLVQIAGLNITHVPYKGGGAALTAAVSGEVPILFNVVMPDMPQVRAGKLRALAVMTADRSAIAPEVPTMREAMPELLGDFEVSSWYGIFLPAGAAPAIVDAVAKQVKAFTDKPETQRRMAAVGGQSDYRSPADFADYVKKETAKFSSIIRKAGLENSLN